MQGGLSPAPLFAAQATPKLSVIQFSDNWRLDLQFQPESLFQLFSRFALSTNSRVALVRESSFRQGWLD